MTFHSAGLELLVPKGGMVLPGYTKIIPPNWKLRLPSHHFKVPVTLKKQAKKKKKKVVTVFAGVI